jgi:two-component system chemotaxis response regulator CheB
MDSGWIIAIGASGGPGLEDICDLLSVLPRDLDAVVLIVLHRPWDQASNLAEVLSKRSQMAVAVAGQGEFLVLGTAYIGEPSIHLTLLENTFALLTADRARLYGDRTIDLLFQSVADCGGNKTIGVVLSGSLDDGSRGLSAIHHAGGQTMALRPSSLLGHGMPENAIAFDGPVSVIGSGSELAAAIIRLVRPDGKQS